MPYSIERMYSCSSSLNVHVYIIHIMWSQRLTLAEKCLDVDGGLVPRDRRFALTRDSSLPSSPCVVAGASASPLAAGSTSLSSTTRPAASDRVLLTPPSPRGAPPCCVVPASVCCRLWASSDGRLLTVRSSESLLGRPAVLLSVFSGVFWSSTVACRLLAFGISTTDLCTADCDVRRSRPGPAGTDCGVVVVWR